MKVISRSVIILMLILLMTCELAYAGGAFVKLGRGLSNTVTGWMELPIEIYKGSKVPGHIGGLIYGLPIGIVKAATRTFVGVYETITFALPYPNDYESILEPAFVMGSPMENMETE